MHGILIVGGLGTRLGLFTRRISNKALIPVFKNLVFEYPLNTLVKSGITNITIVVGGRYAGELMNVIGDGKEFGVEQLSYVYQKEPKGISDAIYKAKATLPMGSKVAVILGDNFFEDSISKYVEDFNKIDKGCFLFLKKVNDPERFGVAKLDHGYSPERISKIIEKPKLPESNLAVTGLYFYDYSVFEKIESLKPSPRGEIEVTDLNNLYVEEGNGYPIKLNGYWSDMGEYPSILETSKFIKESNFDPWKV